MSTTCKRLFQWQKLTCHDRKTTSVATSNNNACIQAFVTLPHLNGFLRHVKLISDICAPTNQNVGHKIGLKTTDLVASAQRKPGVLSSSLKLVGTASLVKTKTTEPVFFQACDRCKLNPPHTLAQCKDEIVAQYRPQFIKCFVTASQ